MSYIEEMHRIVGRPDLDEMGPPGIVGVLPNDYVPSPLGEGPWWNSVPAGAGGTRAEMALTNVRSYGSVVSVVIEITELWVSMDTAGGVAVYQRVTKAGFTDLSDFKPADLRSSFSGLRSSRKNTAAATSVAAPAYQVAAVQCPVANTWVYCPGMRAILGPLPLFAPDLFFQPGADAVGFKIMGRWRHLESRKL